MNAEGFAFSEAVRRGMARRDSVATGMELLGMSAGFSAIWVDDAKRPYPALTPHGVKDATRDSRVLQEWSLVVPDSGLAVVLPGGMACVDRDDLNVPVEGLPAGTWGEATRRGEHRLITLPESIEGKCQLPGRAGDFLAGPDAYVVLSPSQDRWPFDIDAPVMPLDLDSALWHVVTEKLHRRAHRRAAAKTQARLSASTRAQDRAVAALVKKLTQGQFGETVHLIMEGRWQERYSSRSEADFALAFTATHFSRDENTIAAMLDKYSLKARDHSDPEGYIAVTTTNALAARDHTNAERIERLRSMVSDTDITEEDVYDGTPPCRKDLISGILRFACAENRAEYVRPDGWQRIPVDDFATVFGVNRKTVWRALEDAETRGLIERKHTTNPHDGGHRRDSLFRPASASE